MRTPAIIVAPLAVATALLAGCGTTAAKPEAAGSSSAAAPAGQSKTECDTIESAYNAWKSAPGHVETAAEVMALTATNYQTTAAEGDTLMTAVSGQQDQPAKELALAVSDYNMKLSFATLPITTKPAKKITEKTSTDVEKAVAEVHRTYLGFRTGTCAN